MRLRAITTTLALALTPLAPLVGTTSAHAAATTYHVATTGSDRNPGSSVKPFRSVQRAVDAAKPGTTILVHAGTYAGQITIKTSGTSTARITLTSAGDGKVTLTSSPKPEPCNQHKPAFDRTIMVSTGADNWTIRGLSIVGGINVFGRDSYSAYQWLDNRVKSGDWRSRRAVPGRGVNDPVAARQAVSYLNSRVGGRLDPSDGIHILSNTITRRGIHATLARYGRIEGNTISSVDCGTGPAVWLITLSDGWSVANNFVHHVAASTHKHYMQEGIRVDVASNYNRVENNRVEDLPGDGRALNTDVDASYNTFRGNVARRVAIGFNDQKAGWGNTWTDNSVEGFRVYGYAVRLADGNLARPSMDTSANGVVMSCNRSSGGTKDLGVGGTRGARFQGNSFDDVYVSRNAQAYWGAEGNRWNGSSNPPSSSPTVTRVGC